MSLELITKRGLEQSVTTRNIKGPAKADYKLKRKSSVASRVAGAILIQVNLIVMIITLFLFAMGLWMISSPVTMGEAIRRYGTAAMKGILSPEVLTAKMGVGLAGVTLVLFFIAFMGFYGAVSRTAFPLFMYAIFGILLLLLESALFFYFKSEIQTKGLQERDEDWNHIFRLTFKCCEFNSSTVSEHFRIPWSCCGHNGHPSNCTVVTSYQPHCHNVISEWLNRTELKVYCALAASHVILAVCAVVRRSGR